MHVRKPAIPDEPSHRTAAPSPAGGAVIFRVPLRYILTKFATVGVLALVAALGSNRQQVWVGVFAVTAGIAYALRDVLARDRLRADAAGVVAVHGYAGRRRLAWSEIERVRVYERTRLGARTELLELDAGEEIFLYSRYDLGVDPGDALATLGAVRRRPAPSTSA